LRERLSSLITENKNLYTRLQRQKQLINRCELRVKTLKEIVNRLMQDWDARQKNSRLEAINEKRTRQSLSSTDFLKVSRSRKTRTSKESRSTFIRSNQSQTSTTTSSYVDFDSYKIARFRLVNVTITKEIETTEIISTSENDSIAELITNSKMIQIVVSFAEIIFESTNAACMLIFDYDLEFIDNAVKNMTSWFEEANIVSASFRRYMNARNEH
jgi:hypothetical protein